MPSRRAVALCLALLVLFALPACAGGDSDADSAAQTTVEPAPRLPPDGTEATAALYDDRLRPLGWRVQRASLEQRDDPPGASAPTTDSPEPAKRHYAVYLRPLGEPTTQDYLDGLATVSKVFLPEVFETYADLQSFDVCLEPSEAVDPSDYPKTVTQVLVTRAHVAQFDWRAAEPADVVAGGMLRHPNTLVLLVSPQLRQTAEWEALRAAAQARV